MRGSAVLSLFFVASFLAISAPVHADFDYPDFSGVAGLKLNGDAVQDGDKLQLTTPTAFSSGSTFTADPVALGNLNTFSTHFQFRISDSSGISDGDGPGADGLVFVVQTVSSSVGGSGGGIGFSGIPNSLGIEFDTFDNGAGFNDPNGNHVGIDLNGNIASAVTAIEPTRFNNGEVWNAWIDYDGAAKSLEVRWSLLTVRPDTAQLSASVDLTQVLGQNTAFVGFTSGTGSGFGRHDILSWQYRQTLAAVSEPASVLHLGIGGLVLLGLGRRRRRRDLAALSSGYADVAAD